MTELTQGDLDALRQYDTPTICNALELLDSDYRFRGFTTQPFVCLSPALAPMVGYACTATLRASTPPAGDAEANRQRRLEYYEYVAAGAGAGPSIVVIQDLDPAPGYGAFWGEVNTHVHRGLGALGVITNGSIRDLDACASEFQLLAGKVGPSHAWVHTVDWGGRINVHGMDVSHGDLIHADHHGAVVIAQPLAREVPGAVDLLVRREKVILDVARRSDFSIEKLRQALADSAEIH